MMAGIYRHLCKRPPRPRDPPVVNAIANFLDHLLACFDYH
jgi:hypothetical protein